MTKKPHSNQKAQKQETAPEDPAALEKLSAGVRNLGIALGVQNDPPQSSQLVSHATSTKPVSEQVAEVEKNDFQKDMTQDEKKAQRAKKAAEKKARAEAAAAKKAVAANEPQKQKNQGGTTQKLNEKKESTEKPKSVENASNHDQEKVEKKEAAAHPTKKQATGHKNNENAKAGKSALRPHGAPQSNGRAVQFDLAANQTQVMKSESDESLSCVADPPIAPLEDASAFAHVHPAFLSLVARCDKELIYDLEQLCREFIDAFKLFLSDWVQARQRDGAGDPKTLGHDLDLAIRPQITHLTQGSRWPLPYALGNIVRQMKREISKMDGSRKNSFNGNSDSTLAQIEVLVDWLDDASKTNFVIALDTIAFHLAPKMKNMNRVLTYDWCPVVNHVILSTLEKFPKLGVCVVDSELNGRGIRHVEALVEKGHRCQYTDISSIGYAISQCSMVLLGCSAILSNGCVAATKGAMQIALTAKHFNVPVLVASQSVKFVDKVQSYNRVALLSRESVELLPSSMVTAIVTDIRILSPPSAPAVLKAKALDME